jgi:hypothetical protein
MCVETARLLCVEPFIIVRRYTYPEAAEAGWRWIKEGRYWIAYSLTRPPLIVAVIYDQADLPRRI